MRSLAILVGLASLVHLAHADDASDAETLFNEGQQAKEAGNTAEACTKFRQSLEKNRNAVGTILNVALCFEEEGKIASAYKLYSEAEARAHEGGFAEHEKAAHEHKSKIGVDVPHVAIAFAEQARDMKLVIDDQIVDINAANDVEIDPGTRTIVVTAPGRVAYTTTLSIAKGEHKAIAIPKLGHPVSGGRAGIGKVLTFSGAGLVVIGIGVGIYAHQQYNNQFDGSAPHCMNPDAEHPTCDQTGYTKTQNARTLGWVGTGVGAAGLAAAGIGAFLWFTAPRSETTHVAIVPTVTPEVAGLTAIGSF
jgi:hypothetical protein